MDFKYIYLFQDLLGLLIVFIYGRLLITCFRVFIKKGFTISIIKLFLSQVMLILGGFILIFSPWGIKTLNLFILTIVGAFLLTPRKKGEVK